MREFGCPVTCGIVPHQGSNPCLLHWQTNSQPLDHQGSPLPFLKGSFAKAGRFPELIRNPPAVRFKGGLWAFLVAQTVKNLPPMLEIWVRFLGQEDPLEKGMATYSSILAWKIPWTEKPATAKSLQSCPTLCDPIDDSPPGSPVRGILQARTLKWVAISFSSAWWATVHGVAEPDTT